MSKRISTRTFLEEAKREKQRFYELDRVRLRSKPSEKGTVVKCDGYIYVRFDSKPKRIFMIKRASLENVWIDPETGEEEE